MKRGYLIGAVALLFLLLSGCSQEPTADSAQRVAQEKTLQEAGRQVGLPNITNWQELKLAKRIYELRDRVDLPTFTYLVDLNGKLHFLTRSLGYGLPYSAQISNPQKVVYGSSGAAFDTTLPQAEPNGLFIPDSADGTWIIAVGDKGESRPIYVEPRVIVSPIRLKTTEANP